MTDPASDPSDFTASLPDNFPHLESIHSMRFNETGGMTYEGSGHIPEPDATLLLEAIAGTKVWAPYEDADGGVGSEELVMLMLGGTDLMDGSKRTVNIIFPVPFLMSIIERLEQIDAWDYRSPRPPT